MNKEQLLRYATLKSEIKRMEVELSSLKPLIVSEMETVEQDELILPDIGKFFFKERRIWTYSEDIDDMEKSLKAEKKVAQQKGLAEYVIFKDLNFRGKDEQGTEEI